MLGKCRVRAARIHKLTTTVSSREIRICKEKIFQRSRVFSKIFVSKIDWKILGAKPKSHKHWRDGEGFEETHTHLEAIFQMMRAAAKISQRAKTIEILFRAYTFQIDHSNYTPRKYEVFGAYQLRYKGQIKVFCRQKRLSEISRMKSLKFQRWTGAPSSIQIY